MADIPWGMMEIEKDQLPEGNRNWIALQRWLDVSNEKLGITWCPLDAPIFEVGNMTANILGSATNSKEWITKLEPSATVFSWALNNHWFTNFPLSQGGELIFRYRINPHMGGNHIALANRFALEQYQPLIPVNVSEEFKEDQLLAIEGDPSVQGL